MIIEKVNIDNFGIFQDKAISDLKPGLNLIFGNNESGKTTFAEFIKRTMFRHPDRRSTIKPYEMPGNPSPGGTIFCRTSGGTEFSIARHGVRNGGNVEVIRNGNTGGEELLRDLINVSESFYRNIYAITLEELHSAEFMKDDELKSSLFSAGLETGTVSLSKLRADIESEMKTIFTPQGKNPVRDMADQALELRSRIREAEAVAATVDQLQDELDKNRQQAIGVKKELTGTQIELDKLSRRRNAYGTWLRLREELENLQNCKIEIPLPSDILTRLAELKSALNHASGQLEKLQTQHKQASIKLAGINPDTTLLEVGNKITSLFREVQVMRERKNRQIQLDREIAELQSPIEHEIKAIGSSWNESGIAKFTGGKILAENLSKFKTDIDRLKRERETARAVATARTPGTNTSVPWSWLIGLLAIAGGTTIIILWSLTAGITLIVAALIYAFLLGRSNKNQTGQDNDPLEKISQELVAVKQQVAKSLDEAGFDSDLTPDSALICLNSIEKCAELIQRRDLLVKEKNNLITAEQNYAERYITICKKISRDRNSDPTTGSELLNEELSRAKEEYAQRKTAENALGEIAVELVNAEDNNNQATKAYNDFLRECKADDEAQLRDLAEKSARHSAISEKIRTLETSLRENCASDEYDAFIAELENYSPDDADLSKRELESTIESLDNQLTELNQRIGTLEEQLRTIENSRQLENDRTELDSLTKRLNGLSREWTKRQLALQLLDQAVAKFERERRPGVIKAAAEHFRELTDGAYVDVIQTLEDNNLIVQGSDGSIKQVAQLSRGTREELLLCMRLGIVAEFEKNAESLPLILDDVLVDFDTPRRRTAVQMLAEFAKNRQLIIMSCHQETVDLYRGAKANIINF